MSAPNFFRAVNLRADLDHPHRLSHYHPTTRSIAVVEAVLRNDASIVIAAYGSGALDEATRPRITCPSLRRIKSV